MGARHDLLEERRRIGIRRAVGEHAADEAIAERVGVGGEALRLAEAVSSEAVGHHGEVLALQALAHRDELLGSDLDARGVVQR